MTEKSEASPRPPTSTATTKRSETVGATGGGVQTSFLFPYSGSEKSSIMLRHGERANVLWADGHASSEGARDLAENKGKQNRYLVAGSGAWLPIL